MMPMHTIYGNLIDRILFIEDMLNILWTSDYKSSRNYIWRMMMTHYLMNRRYVNLRDLIATQHVIGQNINFHSYSMSKIMAYHWQVFDDLSQLMWLRHLPKVDDQYQLHSMNLFGNSMLCSISREINLNVSII